MTKISDLKSNSGMVTVEGKVVTAPVIREVTTLKKETVKLASFELADETGQIEINLWRETTDLAEKLSVDDHIKVGNTYVNQDPSGRLRLSSSTLTSLNKL